MKKRLQEFKRHRERWVNDEEYRMKSAEKVMIYDVPGTGWSNPWTHTNAEELSPAIKSDIVASEVQFACVFLEPIVFPQGTSGAMSNDKHAMALVEAVTSCNPPFCRLVVDVLNMNPDNAAAWLADELLHAKLAPERKLADFDRYEPELIARGVSALRKVVDMYDVAIGM